MVGHLKGGERNRVLGPQGHILVDGLGNKVLFLGENEGVGIHGWKDKELGCCQWGSCENGGRSQVLGLEVESSSCYLQELGCEGPVPEDVPAKVGRCQHLGTCFAQNHCSFWLCLWCSRPRWPAFSLFHTLLWVLLRPHSPSPHLLCGSLPWMQVGGRAGLFVGTGTLLIVE